MALTEDLRDPREDARLSYTSIKSMLPIILLIQRGNNIVQVLFVVIWIWDREVVVRATLP